MSNNISLGDGWVVMVYIYIVKQTHYLTQNTNYIIQLSLSRVLLYLTPCPLDIGIKGNTHDTSMVILGLFYTYIKLNYVFIPM